MVHKTKAALLNMLAGTEEGDAMAAVTLAIVSGDDIGLRALLKGLGRDQFAQASSAEVEDTDDGGVVRLWPLLVAVKCRNDSAVRLLVDDYGARSRLDAHGRTELHALAESQRGPFEPRPRTMASPPGRHSAVVGWLSDSVRSWLRLEPSPLSPDLRTWQLLISAGAKPFAGDKYGATPFHIACSRGNWPAVEYLLAAQAQARRSGRGRSDPIAALPLPLLRDEQGETGLHWAARSGRSDVVALLLEQPGVDTKLEGDQGTAAEVARRNGHEHIGDMIARATFAESPLMEVPLDVVVHILSFLEPFDLCAVAQVCTKLNEISCADTLWRHFCSSPETAALDTKNEEEEEATARWKTAYMAWLRPRLKLHAQSQVQHLRAQASKGTQPEVVKVILIGEAGVGKTCLIQRYTADQAIVSYVPTIGIDVASKMLTIHGNAVKLWLWEVGGRECFWKLADSYYRTMQGVMFVYDAANAETLQGVQAMYARLIAKHVCCPPALVAPILVGVRHHHGAGQPPASAVSEAQARAAAREIGALAWLEVDGHDALQVDQAFTRLAEAAWSTQNPGFASCWLPAEWDQTQWRIPSKALCDTLFARTALAQSPARSPTTPPPPVA